MQHWLTTIPPLVVLLLVGLVVFVESIGVPFPGEIVLVAAALAASQHKISAGPFAIALAAVLGAAIGDSIGYGLGHRYGDRLFGWLERRFPKHVNADVLAYAEHVFQRYGVVAVFLGRFVALLRIFAGPLSGSLRMHYTRFLPANVLGAICWAGGTAYLVYYLGAAAETYLKNFSYAGLAVAVFLGIIASTLLRRRLERNVQEYAELRRAAD
ncbi:DedA family protein [Allobranchiibius sp. GilTou73]|uniref:DedA family protein n=1 Tax=Allobranchiibius sp. GilTou73 TaxID=2904523 RepID=UPI001F29B1C9|nr:DedA family protein [Allobranchiibius sp. GilTou73]UIJ34770.1 DedA family protein [Allobranchiibius sp. GilTou73]